MPDTKKPWCALKERELIAGIPGFNLLWLKPKPQNCCEDWHHSSLWLWLPAASSGSILRLGLAKFIDPMGDPNSGTKPIYTIHVL